LCIANRVSCWVNSSSLPTAVKQYRLLSTLLQGNVNPSYRNRKDWIERCTMNRFSLTVCRTFPYYLETLSVEVGNFWRWNSILNTRWHYFLCYVILSKKYPISLEAQSPGITEWEKLNNFLRDIITYSYYSVLTKYPHKLGTKKLL
jgi:hypothetical protein